MLRLVTYPTLLGTTRRWMALEVDRKRCGYGKSRAAAVANVIDDEVRERRFGHLRPPGHLPPGT